MSQVDRVTGLVGYSGVKVPVQVAATTNITLTGEQTIDGVLTAESRVLLTAQTDATENGIWVSDSGDWSRSQDCDGPFDLRQGSIVNVYAGTSNLGFWQCTAADPVDIETDNITFARVSLTLASIAAFMQTFLASTTAAQARTAISAAGSGAVTGSGLTMTTARILGRTTASTGAIEEITIGSGLSLAAGSLSTTGAAATIPGLLQNVGLTVTMSANAVTIALTDAALATPSASSPAVIGYRNATITSGASSQVSTTGALSTVISSGSTGGTVSAEASRIWIGAILVSGATELAWFQSRSGMNIAQLGEGGLISTTAEGGVGGADSAQTWYSTTARTNVPVTIIGYFDSTQATAGTWASAAGVVVVNPVFRPGDIVTSRKTQTGAVATGTTVVPFDDTIPQNTEGDQYMTVSITPRSAANILEIKSQFFGANSAASNSTALAIFQDSTASALATTGQRVNAGGTTITVQLVHRMLAALIVSTTINTRAGNDTAGTTTFNGAAAARIYGGVANSFSGVEEIMV